MRWYMRFTGTLLLSGALTCGMGHVSYALQGPDITEGRDGGAIHQIREEKMRIMREAGKKEPVEDTRPFVTQSTQNTRYASQRAAEKDASSRKGRRPEQSIVAADADLMEIILLFPVIFILVFLLRKWRDAGPTGLS